jgi:V-type H+-transporting ATPase subunit e
MSIGGSIAPLIIVSVFWAIVGIVCPFFVPKGPNKGLIQTMLSTIAACCWLFWLVVLLAQVNPLIGPELTGQVALTVKNVWE